MEVELWDASNMFGIKSGQFSGQSYFNMLIRTKLAYLTNVWDIYSEIGSVVDVMLFMYWAM